MKSLTFTLSDHNQVNRLLKYLKENWSQAVKDKKCLVVSVSNKGEEYTSAQRRLYFSWVTQFAKHQGDDDKSIHLYFKKKFLIDIYRRDDAGFEAMCHAMAAMKDNEPEQYKAVAEGVIDLTSITKAKKIQLSEYLDKIYHFCREKNCWLSCPDDLCFLREMKGY